MKKIGIFTLYKDNYNYGGVLQAYALCKIINSFYYDCKVISYKSNYNPIYPSTKEQLKQYSKFEILTKFKEKLICKIKSKKFLKIFKYRSNVIDEFKNTYIPHTELYNDERLKNDYKDFNYIISGSDQVWNPNCGRIGFLQQFKHDGIIKISYAASISRDKLSGNEKKIMIPAINDFDFISVREETAKKILEKDIGKDIYVTLDPTLLLEDEEWDEIDSLKYKDKENYVLCYFFSNSIKYRKLIHKFCENNNLKMIYIPFAKQEYNLYDFRGAGERAEQLSPQDFVSLFKNAKYIFTDSFHGLVFSIIFRKKFLIFNRSKNSKVSMNSRLSDILKKFNIENRLVDSNIKMFERLNEEIDYKNVENLLCKYRTESIEFLKKSLS